MSDIEKENVSEGVSTPIGTIYMLEWGGTGLLAVEWDGMVECGVESDMVKVKVCNVETSSKDNAESTEKLH